MLHACHTTHGQQLLNPVHCDTGRDFDIDWLTSPGRYAVSPKCDGTRCLMLVDETGSVFFRSRIGTLYEFPVRGANFSPGTVLDGELLWLGGLGFFLAFDALCIGRTRVWHLPTKVRTCPFTRAVIVHAVLYRPHLTKIEMQYHGQIMLVIYILMMLYCRNE